MKTLVVYNTKGNIVFTQINATDEAIIKMVGKITLKWQFYSNL